MSAASGSDIGTLPPKVGLVDYYGYHTGAKGWFLCGWMPGLPAEIPGHDGEAHVVFDTGRITGQATVVQFTRDDLLTHGVGLVLFISSLQRSASLLVSVEYSDGSVVRTMAVVADAPEMRETDLVHRLRPVLESSFRCRQRRDLIAALMSRHRFEGETTLENLHTFVTINVDEAILCPPDGLILIGWWLFQDDSILSITLKYGQGSIDLRSASKVTVSRPDVVERIGRPHAKAGTDCGFMIFVTDFVTDSEDCYIEVETTHREIGYQPIPSPRLQGWEAERRILSSFDVGYGDVVPAMASVVSPAILRLNRAFLKQRRGVIDLAFGKSPASPQVSLVIPLHGRIDHFECQMGLFAAHQTDATVEVLYVLDDATGLRTVAESVFARFGAPFRMIVSDQSLGVGPSRNLGFSYAHGGCVCFLGADVFPGPTDWPRRLAARLSADSSLGTVGPLLLSQAGTVQSEGVILEPVRRFGDLPFPKQRRQGLRPSDERGLVYQSLISGACMMLPRAVIESLHGFDEDYVISDFEDSDLCLRLRGMGLKCGVDHDVQLYHLESRTDAVSDQLWRRNLTLCNAWLHHSRWASAGDAPKPVRGKATRR